MSTSGGYHEYHVCSVHWGMFSTSGGIISTSGDVQYMGGIQYIGGCHDNIEGIP